MRRTYWWEEKLEDEEETTTNPNSSTSSLDVKSSSEYKNLKKNKEELETKIKNHKEKQKKIIDDALEKILKNND